MSSKLSPYPIPTQALPVLTRVDWDPAEKWFRDTPRDCPTPYCGGRLMVEPAAEMSDGRVWCAFGCGREVATISLTSTLFVIPRGKRWSNNFDRCTVCGKTDSRHSTVGRCMRCQARHRRHSLAATAAPSGGEAGA